MPTIGVAIEVPEPYGSELRHHRSEFGDPLAATVPSHVTLLPPTEVAEDGLDDVYAALDRASCGQEPFTMRLRGTATFRPVSPVVFVAVSEGISNTELIAKQVRSELSAREPDFPFHPHVTVAHHLDDEALDLAFAGLADFECTFEVGEFVLYLHDEHDGWVTHRRFALR